MKNFLNIFAVIANDFAKKGIATTLTIEWEVHPKVQKRYLSNFATDIEAATFLANKGFKYWVIHSEGGMIAPMVAAKSKTYNL
jgi:predicted transcriptional regulator